jgi:D-alanyl-D-alanine carboxypeptidase
MALPRGLLTRLPAAPRGVGTGRARPARAFMMTLLTVALLSCLAARPATAQIGSPRYSSVVLDAATGNVVSAINPDEPRYPASLTKMMTLYLAFEALRDRRIALDQLVPVSAHAASMEPSKLGLVPGSRLTVEEAVLALVTKSANDAASALGELLGGTEEQFGQIMTLRARSLGMTQTVFRNASGLPDPEQVTTARDLAVLARHLVQDFPAEYHYFSVPSFVFHGRVIPNHDHMLQTYPGADGIKTGYIVASGFNLVTSAKRGDVRLIGVVLGAARAAERDENMAALLDAGFVQLGVPIAPAHHWMAAGRSFGLVASAQASTLPIATPTMRALLSHVSSRHIVYSGTAHRFTTPAGLHLRGKSNSAHAGKSATSAGAAKRSGLRHSGHSVAG